MHFVAAQWTPFVATYRSKLRNNHELMSIPLNYCGEYLKFSIILAHVSNKNSKANYESTSVGVCVCVCVPAHDHPLLQNSRSARLFQSESLVREVLGLHATERASAVLTTLRRGLQQTVGPAAH